MQFPSNKVCNQKYNVFTFVPKVTVVIVAVYLSSGHMQDIAVFLSVSSVVQNCLGMCCVSWSLQCERVLWPGG